jgi:hypothetical protein
MNSKLKTILNEGNLAQIIDLGSVTVNKDGIDLHYRSTLP